jgi:hypothetical protein
MRDKGHCDHCDEIHAISDDNSPRAFVVLAVGVAAALVIIKLAACLLGVDWGV